MYFTIFNQWLRRRYFFIHRNVSAFQSCGRRLLKSERARVISTAATCRDKRRLLINLLLAHVIKLLTYEVFLLFLALVSCNVLEKNARGWRFKWVDRYRIKSFFPVVKSWFRKNRTCVLDGRGGFRKRAKRSKTFSFFVLRICPLNLYTKREWKEFLFKRVQIPERR